MKTTKPMLEYLATCSNRTLEAFELARLNERANLRKQMIEILDEWVELHVQTRIANWILARQRERASGRTSLRWKDSLLLGMSALVPDSRAIENALAIAQSTAPPLLKESSVCERSTGARRAFPPKSMPKARGKAAAKSELVETVVRVA
ncbi:MAG TPA: hypothetical protein VGR81_00970 [Candidatus Acidoferrales bacterium]|nr:hypothetical protein [Candidatus Acidoferrales bacterium]